MGTCARGVSLSDEKASSIAVHERVRNCGGQGGGVHMGWDVFEARMGNRKLLDSACTYFALALPPFLSINLIRSRISQRPTSQLL